MPDVSQIMVRLRDMVDGVKPNPEWPSDIRALLDEVKRHEREYLELREAHDQKAARATAAEAKLAEVETKERLTYGQWGLTVKLYEQTKASLATATEALRWMNRKGGLGLDVHERIDATLSEIEAGTVEHPDSARLAEVEKERDEVRAFAKRLEDSRGRALVAGAETLARLATATEALREAIEFADQDAQALTPAGERMIARWRTALADADALDRWHKSGEGYATLRNDIRNVLEMQKTDDH